MVSAFIFFLHFIFALTIFTRKWQLEGMSTAFLNLGLIGILFAVGWTLTGMISKILMDADGFGLHFNRDDFSLTILTIVEFIFYRFYYKEPATGDDTEKL